MSCRFFTLLLKTLFQLTHPIETYPFGVDFYSLSTAILHLPCRITPAKLQLFYKTNKFARKNFLSYTYEKQPII